MLPFLDDGDAVVVLYRSDCRSLCSFSCKKDDMAEGLFDSELASRESWGVGRVVKVGDVAFGLVDPL